MPIRVRLCSFVVSVPLSHLVAIVERLAFVRDNNSVSREVGEGSGGREEGRSLNLRYLRFLRPLRAELRHHVKTKTPRTIRCEAWRSSFQRMNAKTVLW